jgi:GGDEF domain-containing protein
MKKGCLIIYYSISLIFFLLVVGLFAFRMRGVYQNNTREISASFEELRVSALSTYLAEGGFTSDYFRTKMKAELVAEPRLLLVSVATAEGETLYLLARNSSYLVSDPRGTAPAAGEKPAVSPANRFLETELAIPFAPGIARDLFIHGRYQQLSRRDLYPVLKEIFYITLAYVLVSGILLLILAGSSDRKAAASGPDLRPYARIRQPPRTAEQPQASPPQARQQEQPAPRAATREARAGFFSPRSGLGWQELLENRLDFELERSASFDQDLVLACLALDPVPGDALKPELYRRVAARISDTFPFKDLCFEDGPEGYAVLLPDKELDQALKEVQRFQSSLASAPNKDKASISAGLSARAGRLLSGSRLLKEARAALKQARLGGATQIVAFRADPEKYRRAAAGDQAAQH